MYKKWWNKLYVRLMNDLSNSLKSKSWDWYI